jgi:hypothetical protein
MIIIRKAVGLQNRLANNNLNSRMKINNYDIIKILLPLILSIVGTCRSSPASWSPVKELEPHNFDQTVSSVTLALVMFYVPWCPHYKRARPKFEASSRYLVRYEVSLVLL